MGAKNFVPRDKEWLCEVVLAAIKLVVDVMVGTVVAKKDVEQIPWEPQPTVVVNSFDGGEGEEEEASPRVHARGKEGYSSANRVEDKALQRVVVQSSKGIGDNQGVMLGMDVLVQELVDVHVPVHEVLPGIQDNH